MQLSLSLCGEQRVEEMHAVTELAEKKGVEQWRTERIIQVYGLTSGHHSKAVLWQHERRGLQFTHTLTHAQSQYIHTETHAHTHPPAHTHTHTLLTCVTVAKQTISIIGAIKEHNWTHRGIDSREGREHPRWETGVYSASAHSCGISKALMPVACRLSVEWLATCTPCLQPQVMRSKEKPRWTHFSDGLWCPTVSETMTSAGVREK